MGRTLVKLAKNDKSIVGITAAMPAGTGLNILEQELPDQFIDVGIAEEHAVLSAAGMATSGFHPVCAIYSTFLQRAFDQLIHDVALQNLPVMFCMDRAGLSPNDGATHHGLFDLAYLRNIPGAVVMAPSNEDELADMMATGIAYQGPCFVRYPRGEASARRSKRCPRHSKSAKPNAYKNKAKSRSGQSARWSPMQSNSPNSFTQTAFRAGVVNARFVKPLDTELLLHPHKHATHRHHGRQRHQRRLRQRDHGSPARRPLPTPRRTHRLARCICRTRQLRGRPAQARRHRPRVDSTKSAQTLPRTRRLTGPKASRRECEK